MTLNVAQYIAPLNSAQVLTGLSQGVRQGVGITILPDGTITLNAPGAATLGFLTSSTTPAPVFNWSLTPSNTDGVLINDGAGNVSWQTNYIQAFPETDIFPHTGAAGIPAGPSSSRPANNYGLLRYNLDYGYLEFNNNSAWLPMSQASGGVWSFVGTATPSPNAIGDLWLDTNTGQEKVWTGITWAFTSPRATSVVPGLVIIGTNIQVDVLGTISVDTVVGLAGGVSNLGVITVTDNVTSTSLDSALSANQGLVLQQQIDALDIRANLTFAGLINGDGDMTYLTNEGSLAGFALGFPLPAANILNDNYFVMVEQAGSFTPPAGLPTVVTQGDWFESTGGIWQFLDVGYDPPLATNTKVGLIRIATIPEAEAGTDNTTAVSPQGLAAAIDNKVSIAAARPTNFNSPGVAGEVFLANNFFYWFDGLRWQRVASDPAAW
jgi:hypothetical protein